MSSKLKTIALVAVFFFLCMIMLVLSSVANAQTAPHHTNRHRNHHQQVLQPHHRWWWWCFNFETPTYGIPGQICARTRENCEATLQGMREEDPNRVHSAHCEHIYQ